ncbi:hypothetical protein B296_00024898 [Ensete ventricosum]|uniref:Uncharacterized protein n=1 Tax=Ensete ventricosum TaxID=4639 RepID=A0A427ASA4_ENSVE|nr:hypothetical protein B296_00024898 [Ensete ventricosum]
MSRSRDLSSVLLDTTTHPSAVIRLAARYKKIPSSSPKKKTLLRGFARALLRIVTRCCCHVPEVDGSDRCVVNEFTLVVTYGFVSSEEGKVDPSHAYVVDTVIFVDDANLDAIVRAFSCNSSNVAGHDARYGSHVAGPAPSVAAPYDTSLRPDQVFGVGWNPERAIGEA